MFKAQYTRKQAGVIYRNIKEGKLHMSAEGIKWMYYRADDPVYADTAAQERIDLIPIIVDDIFRGDLEAAQATLDEYDAYQAVA